MFLNYIKAFSVKRIIKNKLQNERRNPDSSAIKTVGIIVDESNVKIGKDLVAFLVEQGIKVQDVQVLAYRDRIKKNSVQIHPTISAKDLNWNATFSSAIANDFIASDFDLLINYYDAETAGLLLLTHASKAKFKVGFTAIDKRLNDLIINTSVENYTVFTQEIIKYLKILNKI